MKNYIRAASTENKDLFFQIIFYTFIQLATVILFDVFTFSSIDYLNIITITGSITTIISIIRILQKLKDNQMSRKVFFLYTNPLFILKSSLVFTFLMYTYIFCLIKISAQDILIIFNFINFINLILKAQIYGILIDVNILLVMLIQIVLILSTITNYFVYSVVEYVLLLITILTFNIIVNYESNSKSKYDSNTINFNNQLRNKERVISQSQNNLTRLNILKSDFSIFEMKESNYVSDISFDDTKIKKYSADNDLSFNKINSHKGSSKYNNIDFDFNIDYDNLINNDNPKIYKEHKDYKTHKEYIEDKYKLDSKERINDMDIIKKTMKMKSCGDKKTIYHIKSNIIDKNINESIDRTNSNPSKQKSLINKFNYDSNNEKLNIVDKKKKSIDSVFNKHFSSVNYFKRNKQKESTFIRRSFKWDSNNSMSLFKQSLLSQNQNKRQRLKNNIACSFNDNNNLEIEPQIVSKYSDIVNISQKEIHEKYNFINKNDEYYYPRMNHILLFTGFLMTITSFSVNIFFNNKFQIKSILNMSIIVICTLLLHLTLLFYSILFKSNNKKSIIKYTPINGIGLLLYSIIYFVYYLPEIRINQLSIMILIGISNILYFMYLTNKNEREKDDVN